MIGIEYFFYYPKWVKYYIDYSFLLPAILPLDCCENTKDAHSLRKCPKIIFYVQNNKEILYFIK